MGGRGVALVVPAYDEADIIERTLDRMQDAASYVDELYLADDGSTDGTAERAADYIAEHNLDVELYRNERNGGKVGAIQHTVEDAVDAAYTLVMDADSWLDTPETLPDTLDYIEREDLAGVGLRVAPAITGDNRYQRALQGCQQQGYAFGRLQHRLTSWAVEDELRAAADRCRDRDAAGGAVESAKEPADRFAGMWDEVATATQSATADSLDTAAEKVSARDGPRGERRGDPQLRHMAGAGYLVETRTLAAALKQHSREFDGEDMQTTALIQFAVEDDLAYFPDLTVKTEVPDTLTGLRNGTEGLLPQRTGWHHGALHTYAERAEDYLTGARDPRRTLTWATVYELGFMSAVAPVLAAGVAHEAVFDGNLEPAAAWYLTDAAVTAAGLELGYRMGELEDRSYARYLPAMPVYRAAAFFPGKLASYREFLRTTGEEIWRQTWGGATDRLETAEQVDNLYSKVRDTIQDKE